MPNNKNEIDKGVTAEDKLSWRLSEVCAIDPIKKCLTRIYFLKAF